MGEIGLEVIIGSLTFTGSLIAAGKLQEILPQRPITYNGQNYRQPLGAGAALVLRSLSWSIRSMHVSLPGHGRGRAAIRNLAGHAHRRRGHADGHLALELLRRLLGRAARLRAQ